MNQHSSNAEKKWVLEDFIKRSTVVTARRTITETDIVLTVGLTGHYQPLFTDQEFARTTSYRERIAPAELTIGILAGLLTRKGILENQIGLLQLDATKFPNPMFAGDTVHAEVEILDTRITSNPERGIVYFYDQVFNQKNEVLLEQKRTAMFWTQKHLAAA